MSTKKYSDDGQEAVTVGTEEIPNVRADYKAETKKIKKDSYETGQVFGSKGVMDFL